MFVCRAASVYLIISVVVIAVIKCSPIEISGDEPQYIGDTYTPIPIISQSEDASPDGSFTYSFETGNHIKQQATGYHKTVLVPRFHKDGSKTGELDAADIIVQSGSYEYISPEGNVISVQYLADENGFQAFSDSIPTPPPIPEQILHALQHKQIRQSKEQPTHELLATQDNANTVTTETAQSDEKQLLMSTYLK